MGAEITDDMLHAAMDAFYPGEDWRNDLGCALETSLRDMKAALIAADDVRRRYLMQPPKTLAPKASGQGIMTKPVDQFIVLLRSIVGSSLADLTTVTDWDGAFHATRSAAKRAGWKARQSDDFNIGVIRDGKLVSVDWMDEPIGETPEAVTDIAIEIGLEEERYEDDEDEPADDPSPPFAKQS